MSEATKKASSKLPYIIVGGVVLLVGWNWWKSRKTDPATGSTTDEDAKTKPTPGGVLDGLLGNVRNIGAQLGNLRDLFAGGGAKGDGDGGQVNAKSITGASDPFFQNAKDPTYTRPMRRMPGTAVPSWGTTWADRASTGDYQA